MVTTDLGFYLGNISVIMLFLDLFHCIPRLDSPLFPWYPIAFFLVLNSLPASVSPSILIHLHTAPFIFLKHGSYDGVHLKISVAFPLPTVQSTLNIKFIKQMSADYVSGIVLGTRDTVVDWKDMDSAIT